MIREWQSAYNADLTVKDADANAAERLRRRVNKSKKGGTTSTFTESFWKLVKYMSTCPLPSAYSAKKLLWLLSRIQKSA